MGAFIPAARAKFRDRLDFVYDLFPRLRERRGNLVTDRGHRALAGPAVGEELDQSKWLSGRHVGGYRQAAQILEAFDARFGAVRPVDHVVHRRGHR